MKLRDEVKHVVDYLTTQGKMFTVFDVTRLVRLVIHNAIHEDVKREVEQMFFAGWFPSSYTRRVGDHLNFLPLNPQIYHPQGSNILKYDPNALDPNRVAGKVCVMTPKAKKASSSNKSYKECVYVAKVKGRDVFLTSREKHRDGRVTSINNASLYSTKNGPVQLINREKTPSAYEVVKYEAIFTPVEN